MTGDSNGAIEALEEAYKTAEDKGDIAYMLGHFIMLINRTIKLFSILMKLKIKKICQIGKTLLRAIVF
jgi:hypothetical protein